MPENGLIHNVIAAVLWNSLIMILQGRQWPSIVPSRSGFISSQDYGDLAMDLPLDQAKPREAAPLSNYILSGRSLYMVALQTRRFCSWSGAPASKECFNNRANWPGPRGHSGLPVSPTSFSTGGNSRRADRNKQPLLFYLFLFYVNCSLFIGVEIISELKS